MQIICYAISPWCYRAASLQPIVTQFGEELKGDERVVVDQLLSKLQCERLIELASVTKSTYSLTCTGIILKFHDFSVLSLLSRVMGTRESPLILKKRNLKVSTSSTQQRWDASTMWRPLPFSTLYQSHCLFYIIERCCWWLWSRSQLALRQRELQGEGDGITAVQTGKTSLLLLHPPRL